MANGFNGSKEEWDRLEAPLIGLDPLLVTIANEHHFTLRKNHKAPERSLLQVHTVQRLLQIRVSEAHSPKYNLWICASEIRNGHTYWKERTVLRNVFMGSISEVVIRNSINELSNWGKDDLEPIGPADA